MIISFQMTADAIRDGTKTVTRRFWKLGHAAKFKREMIVDAWSAGPHRGGEFIRQIRLTRDPYLEPLDAISEEHFEREGGTRYWPNIAEFVEKLSQGDCIPYVIEFEFVDAD